MAECVSYEVEDGIAILAISNPPVNALSWEVRSGLVNGLEAALADPGVAAIVILGEGKTFPAGANISEFGAPPRDPWLPEVCNRIEASGKPVVAALHGTALGGGFEVALSAHHRVADVNARFGLPEVTLGILPGAGGTQRTPRLAGAELALEIMLSGKFVRADDARAGVFFDALIEGDLRRGAIGFARELVEQGAEVRPTRGVLQGFSDPLAYQRGVARARAKVNGLPENAPREIVNCVEAAMLLPFEQGLAFERAAFETLVTSDQSVALRHAFFAERKAAKNQTRAEGSDELIGERVLAAYQFAADMMLEEGATPYLIDEAMEDWGMACGPYRAQDLAGLEASWERRKRDAERRDPADRYVAIGDLLCEAGRFGQKAGRGYYRYEDADREGAHDPEVIALVRSERERKGIAPRGFKPDEIQRRCLVAMVNEGARLLSEGIATRPLEIDAVMFRDHGFPRWRGGPMMAADLTGLLKIKSDLESFARDEPRFWAPEPIFHELIKNGQGFDCLND